MIDEKMTEELAREIIQLCEEDNPDYRFDVLWNLAKGFLAGLEQGRKEWRGIAERLADVLIQLPDSHLFQGLVHNEDECLGCTRNQTLASYNEMRERGDGRGIKE